MFNQLGSFFLRLRFWTSYCNRGTGTDGNFVLICWTFRWRTKVCTSIQNLLRSLMNQLASVDAPYMWLMMGTSIMELHQNISIRTVWWSWTKIWIRWVFVMLARGYWSCYQVWLYRIRSHLRKCPLDNASWPNMVSSCNRKEKKESSLNRIIIAIDDNLSCTEMMWTLLIGATQSRWLLDPCESLNI